MTEWLCPDIEMVELLNISEINTNAKDFRLIIDVCGNEPKCEIQDTDYQTINRFLNSIFVDSKVIYRYFESLTYQNTNDLQFGSDNHMSSGLINTLCMVKEFQITEHQLQIYN